MECPKDLDTSNLPFSPLNNAPEVYTALLSLAGNSCCNSSHFIGSTLLRISRNLMKRENGMHWPHVR